MGALANSQADKKQILEEPTFKLTTFVRCKSAGRPKFRCNTICLLRKAF